MIKFENVEVFNFEGAIRGMRNSYDSWEKSDSYMPDTGMGLYQIGPNDYTLAMTLSKAGSGHDKFLRQIGVSVDIIAPLKWWDEVDQYHFFTTNSTSIMHTLGKERITEEDFSFEDVDEDLKFRYLNLLNTAREQWIMNGKKKPSREWRQMVMLTACGFNYRRTFTTNYGQLKTMYRQRKNHRLQEWRDFAEWVETLPYSEFITVKGEA